MMRVLLFWALLGLAVAFHIEGTGLHAEAALLQKKVDAIPTPFYDYGDYNRLEVIEEELVALRDRCSSGFTCYLESIGQSVEGRDIWLMSIGTGGRPAHWFDATLHAREWLATATLMNIINRLFDQGDDEAVALLAENDYYFLPVANPDGYVYTWENDRMWCKNRGSNAGSSCVGTDLNRNFDHNWGDASKDDQCEQGYQGDSVASEPETQAIQNRAQELAEQLLSWNSIHVFGNYWLWPYADCTKPDRWQDVERVANVSRAAVEATHGTNWQSGNSCQVLYPVPGNNIDYTIDQGILYSFTALLRGDSVAPPASEITPSFEEMWNGIVAMRDEIAVIEGLS